MDAGFEVRRGATGDDSEINILVNQDYKCIVVKRKIKLSALSYVGTVYAMSAPWKEERSVVEYTFGNLPQYKLTLNDDELFWGITLCENISKSIMVKRPSEKDVRFNIPSGTNIGEVYIYTFGLPKESKSRCGLQVFNAKGEIVFDGGLKQLDMYHSDMWLLISSGCPRGTTAVIGAAPPWDVSDMTWFYEVTVTNEKFGWVYPEIYVVKPYKKQGDKYYFWSDEWVFISAVDVSNC